MTLTTLTTLTIIAALAALAAVFCLVRAIIATHAAEATAEVARYQAGTIATLRGKLELAEAEAKELRRK